MFGSLKGVPGAVSMNELLFYWERVKFGLSSDGISIWKYGLTSAKISLSCLPHFILITIAPTHLSGLCFQSNL